MSKLSKTALALAALAAATLPGAGCRSPSGGKPIPETVKHRLTVPGGSGVLQRGQVPVKEQGGASRLLADLAGGDVNRAWRAEKALADMGPAVAPQVRAMLGSASPEARAAACRLAYRFKDIAAIPKIIALLTDGSRMVCVGANVNLCGLTGQDFGFRADALLADRVKAQARWQAWYNRTYAAGSRKRR